MGYISCWRKIPDTVESWRKAFLLDKDKLHMEWYECWHFTDQCFCIKSDEEGNFKEPKGYTDTVISDTVDKYVYGIKNVPKFQYYKIITWHRHPNHWE